MVNQALISEEYQNTQAQYHAEREDWGTSGQYWEMLAYDFIVRNDLATVLDYGCGKNTLVTALSKHSRNIVYLSYDPCIPEYQDNPPRCRGVLCTDVLEHIEPDKIEAVLDDIADKTLKAAFLVISTQQASHWLPDGRNAHLIIEGESYWRPKLEQRFQSVIITPGPADELVCEVLK